MEREAYDSGLRLGHRGTVEITMGQTEGGSEPDDEADGQLPVGDNQSTDDQKEKRRHRW